MDTAWLESIAPMIMAQDTEIIHTALYFSIHHSHRKGYFLYGAHGRHAQAKNVCDPNSLGVPYMKGTKSHSALP